ncbi:hypothetical protein FE257_011128 [Aspergillus nanangensis]|uniref:Uncharacterized protein n=1 Tax=Aspergillus nanangensis TaxID=2582783 RepID=A0AAD4GRN9_ASPNN|nr:hypothetical protein FE257_011128 [Aspergillus nanangensis]
MVFFAYAKTNQDDATWRYIIVAPNMNTLDFFWYRQLHEVKPAAELNRESPEFYTFNSNNIDLGRCTYTGHDSHEFMNKLIFTLLDDVGGRQWPPFINDEHVNRISGNTFYIRSKSDPRVFWYDKGDGKIYASQQGRTRFRIQNKNRALEREVMINSDSISISPVSNKDVEIAIDQDAGLHISSIGGEMTLGDLKSNFLSLGHGDNIRVTQNKDNGEEWELVA